MLPSASQLVFIVLPALIFVSLALMLAHKVLNMASRVAEMRTTPRRRDVTHMSHTRGTQTRELNMTPPDTVFL